LQTTNVQPLAVTRQELLDRLNAQQQEAVSLGWGPSLVIAGAGSGKTTVLTRRIAWLLSELRQPPWSIMAVTFTNKAAAEMKTRLEKLVGEATAKRLTIGTFHSISARMLRREIVNYESPEGFKWKSNFVIYDESDSMNVVKAVVQKLNLDDKVFPPKEMRHAISALKNDGINSYRFAQDARNYKDTRLADIFTQYQSELARNNALDFDDLISIFTDLLERNPEVRSRISDQYRHIMVDEFQDTNQSQFRMIRNFTVDETTNLPPGGSWEQRSLMVVGDVDQSIYSWRKADFRIFLGFQNDYKETHTVRLEENYRSTSTILDVANSIIINNTERLEKTLRCNRGEGGKVRCFSASDEVDEAYFVVKELKQLQQRGIKLSDCCVLYRTNAQSRAMEEVLVRTGMPYTMVGGTRFYDRAEIKDVVAYLKLVHNPDDGIAFNRVVNNPRRGLGKTSIDKLAEFAERSNISMLDAAAQANQLRELGDKAAKTLIKFAEDIRRWQTMSNVMPIAQLLDVVLKESTYLKKLEDEANETKEEVAFGRVENVRELLAEAQDFELTADEPNLEAFLTRTALFSDLDSKDKDHDPVKLMTVHSAKGLEFPTVFIVGLEEGLFPHMRSINSPQAMEEERRLMYVAVTRAEDRLFLSFARRRSSFMNRDTTYTVPSRFLSEIKGDCMVGFDPDPESAFLAQSSGRELGERPYAYNKERENYGQSSGSGSSSGYGNKPSGGGYGGGGYGGGGYGGGGSYSGGKSYGGGSSSGTSSGGSGKTFGKPRWQQDDNGITAPKPVPPEKRRVLSRTAPSGETTVTDPAGIKPQASFERLSVGDSVMHSKFGVGKVTQVIGEGDKELYNVEFQSAGKRLLDPRFAKLAKLD
jgi:DNA helicase-2/ATP-dependent DNA helicase PcrA